MGAQMLGEVHPSVKTVLPTRQVEDQFPRRIQTAAFSLLYCDGQNWPLIYFSSSISMDPGRKVDL